MHVAPILLVTWCLVVPVGYGQAGADPRPVLTSRIVREGSAGVRRASGGRAVYTGRVVYVNVVAETMTVRIGSNTVTFDTSNPVLSGFRSLADVRPGDAVAVSYTSDGVLIQKTKGHADAPVYSTKSPFIIDETPPKKKPHKQAAAAGLQRRAHQGNGENFDEVDVNKDGRITPVELSTLIKNITMDTFRQIDRNGDGTVDRAEFMDAVKRQKGTATR